ncbi:MAG: hypothetical protein COA83_06865 [Methylophaga sp.]|nr:MAG: hypothetical protein COA83_06865 [Methylophaga sp.]
MEKYIDLKRCFIDYGSSSDPEAAAQQSYIDLAFGHDTNLYWDKLLESRYIVVLGEAGSGKSWEFNAQAELLKSNGEFAFSLRLENLVDGDLSHALDACDEDSYQKWHQSEKPVTFFLDSVDEAKLKNHNALNNALNNFVKGIGQHSIYRVNIVISSRISEWRNSTDSAEVRRRFNIPNDNKDANLTLKTVLLAPLNETQLRQLADAKGILNSNDFITAVTHQSALQFASRPLDAELLIQYWQDNHRVGNRQELLEHSIPQKLTEREERQSHALLSLSKARAGAETIAAAAILCKKFNILVPDTDINNESESLNIKVLLPDWSAQEQNALLNLPIFDGATYGHIRFHHRTTTEYLCACWLQQRMHDQLPYPDLEDILFMQVHDKWIVRPALLAVSTWIATLGENPWNKRVRTFLLENNPESFLQFGEPRNLITDDLKRLLHSLIAKYEGRQDVGLATENYQLLALAQPVLANELAISIQDKSISDDIRIEMIQAIRDGGVTQCNDALLNIMDSDNSAYIQHYATKTLSELATTAQLEKLHSIAQQKQQLPSMLCAYLCEALYPKIINPEQFLSLIEKISPNEDRSTIDIPYYLEQLFKNNDIPSSHYKKLLSGIIRLGKKAPHLKRGSQPSNISIEFAWLTETLLHVLNKILAQDTVDDKLWPQISNSLIFIDDSNRVHPSHNIEKEISLLNQLLVHHPAIRQYYAWAIIKLKHPNSTQVYIGNIFGWNNMIKADKSDLEWLLNNIENPVSDIQQEQALKLAVGLHRYVILPKNTKNHLCKAVSGNKKLIRILNQQLPNRIVSTYRQIKSKISDEYFWNSKKRFIKQKVSKTYHYISERIWLHRHIKGIREGKHLHTLDYFTHRSTSQDDPISESYNWKNLVDPYGDRIASAVRDGWIKSWRNYEPSLNENTQGTVVGLAGIRTELTQNPQLLNNISDADAELMMRYAIHSMNSYPDWLSSLAEIRPTAIQNIIHQCIDNEWRHPASDSQYYGTITRLQYIPPIIQDLAINKLQTKLQDSEPEHPQLLFTVLKILLQNATSDKVLLATIAIDKLNALSSNDSSYLNWLVVLLQINGMPAIHILDQELEKPEVDANKLMLNLAGHIDSRHGSLGLIGVNPAYKSAQCLRILIPLVYRYIKLAEDITRRGTYRANDRDAAQSFRNELLPWLANRDESNVYQLLSELLPQPELKREQDFILRLMDKRAERDADLRTWLPKQVYEFEKEHESQPRSNHDLFRLVCRRLLSIKDHVERDDYSPRDTFNLKSLEPKLRKWLANQLKSRANGKYTEVQEVEVDLDKKPDIRLVAPNIHPVSIEIKWADNWTIKELETALETQLVGQYLRTPDSNYGILLLGYRGKKKVWVHGKTKARLNLQKLVIHLQTLADNIKQQNDNVYGLEVISFDFTDPSHQ